MTSSTNNAASQFVPATGGDYGDGEYVQVGTAEQNAPVAAANAANAAPAANVAAAPAANANTNAAPAAPADINLIVAGMGALAIPAK